MKKQITAEQSRRREERKARFALLVQRVAKMSDVEKAELMAGCNIVNVDGHALSVRNQMFIIWQLGRTATIVGGFRQWIKQGRCVRKGEHGASILFPRSPSEKTESGEHSTQDKVYFLSGTVFDVSQTEEIAGQTTETQNEAIVEHCGELAIA